MTSSPSTAGASILAVGYLLPLIYLTLSLWLGRDAGPNPWDASGLEWETSAPPPKFNFDETPVVVGGPYVYPLGEPEGRDERAPVEPLPQHAGRS